MTTKLAVVYHSGYGHTAKVAEHVAEGARAYAEVVLFNADEATARIDELAAFDAIVFGAPTYMGSVSAPFKAFMDASAKVWYSQGWKDKIAGHDLGWYRPDAGWHHRQRYQPLWQLAGPDDPYRQCTGRGDAGCGRPGNRTPVWCARGAKGRPVQARRLMPPN